jgi:hypothetical protein
VGEGTAATAAAAAGRPHIASMTPTASPSSSARPSRRGAP